MHTRLGALAAGSSSIAVTGTGDNSWFADSFGFDACIESIGGNIGDIPSVTKGFESIATKGDIIAGSPGAAKRVAAGGAASMPANKCRSTVPVGSLSPPPAALSVADEVE
jgi:hypothetical protein